jgi:murein DD-endopeptidase MepM/ murein hydrolase activator NlpD
MRSQRLASPLRGLLLLLLGVLVGANATYFLMTRDAVSPASLASGPATDSVARQAGPPESAGAEIAQPPAEPVLPPPVARINGTAAGSGSPSATAHAQANGAGLLLPVQGITPSQLTDTFTDARSAGRTHDAIDIMAPAGTPVLAVADGHVEKLFTSKLGGLTIYEFNADNTLAYYYAHLQRYADGLAEQQLVKRGQLLGYVGSTGDASPRAPHLHFAISVLGPEKQWWKGEAINPYPLLGGAPH